MKQLIVPAGAHGSDWSISVDFGAARKGTVYLRPRGCKLRQTRVNSPTNSPQSNT